MGTKRDGASRPRPTGRSASRGDRPDRDAAGRGAVWIVGRRPVAEAVAAGRAVELLVADGARLPEAGGVPCRPVDRATLDRLAGGAVHQGVAARVRPVRLFDLEDLLVRAAAAGQQGLVVIAAGVQDPRNLGAIARSAEAAGAHGLVVPARRSAPLGPAAEKAAAGALTHLPVAKADNLPRAVQACQRAGLWTYAADPAGESLYTEVDWRRAVALVIGGEGAGVPRLVRDRCDARVRLPMRGRIASLNAAVAAGVMLYEIVRQRG